MPNKSTDMPRGRIMLAELQANQPIFSPEQRARLETSARNDAEADADPVNPTWDDQDLEKTAFARAVRLAREKTGLSQPLFAARFHIKLTRLRDWERARFKPDSVAAAYIKTILVDATAVTRALDAAESD